MTYHWIPWVSAWILLGGKFGDRGGCMVVATAETQSSWLLGGGSVQVKASFDEWSYIWLFILIFIWYNHIHLFDTSNIYIYNYMYVGSSFLYAVMGCENGVCFVFPIGSSPVEWGGQQEATEAFSSRSMVQKMIETTAQGWTPQDDTQRLVYAQCIYICVVFFACSTLFDLGTFKFWWVLSLPVLKG